MIDFESTARTTVDRLRAQGVGFALVGGFAVSVRCEPRFTRDVDLVVAVAGDDEAEAVVKALVLDGYGLLAMSEHDVAGRLATARLSLGDGDDVVDLLFASSGIEAEIVESAEPLEVLPDLVLPVAAADRTQVAGS